MATCDKCHGYIQTVGCKCEVDKLKAQLAEAQNHIKGIEARGIELCKAIMMGIELLDEYEKPRKNICGESSYTREWMHKTVMVWQGLNSEEAK